MKLKELLTDKEIHIEYRTNHPEFGDIFHGACVWTGSKLEPYDGDSYSIEDEIKTYEWNSPSDLTVWYESKWITG